MPEKTLILTEEGKPFSSDAEKKAMEILQQGGLEAIAISETDSKAKDMLPDAGYLIVRSNKVTAGTIDSANKLKLVVRAGAGYDNIDLAAATAKNVYVMNTPGQNATAVAELVMSMMHTAIRPLNGKSGTELKNKKLGIIGFGNIGKLVAIIAKGYGMDVDVYDILETKETAMQYGVKFAESVMDAIKGKDFVSLHIPSTSETKNSVNTAYFEAMKKNGVIINTARADVINHADLIRHMEANKGFKYFSDVDQKSERLAAFAKDHPEQVFITGKKMGAETKEANFNAATAAAQQIVDFHNKGVTRFAVNNPIPPEFKLYTDLSMKLSRFCSAFITNPREVQYSCYGSLQPYSDIFAEYMLKGMFEQAGHAQDITPSEARSLAEEHGIKLKKRPADDRKGYGLAMTLGFISGEDQLSLRGTVEEDDLQISRLMEYKIRIPLRKAVYLVVQVNDKPGIEYEIAQHVVNAGFNRSDLGYSTNQALGRGLAFYIVDKKGADHETLTAELKKVADKVKGVDGVIQTTIVDLAAK